MTDWSGHSEYVALNCFSRLVRLCKFERKNSTMVALYIYRSKSALPWQPSIYSVESTRAVLAYCISVAPCVESTSCITCLVDAHTVT